MKTRKLGRTSITITPIGLGCWQFGQGVGSAGMFWKPIDQKAITAVVAAAIGGGISWFDTAESYGRGVSEKSLAAALTTLGVEPGRVGVSTKWWPLLRTARSIEGSFDRRSGALTPHPIDLYQVHHPWSFSSISAQMKAMARLVKAGRIKAVGVSNFSAEQMEEAHAVLATEGVPLASAQVRFNLLDRRIERNGVLEAARRLGVTVIAWSPLAQGLLTGRFHDDPSAVARVPRVRRLMNGINRAGLARTAPLIEELRAVAKAHGVTPAQVVLNWTVSVHGETVVAIPGASRPGQAEQSAGAMALRLTDLELARIDAASRKVAGDSY